MASRQLVNTVQHIIISDQTHNILSRFFLSRSFSQNIKCKKWFLSCSPDPTTNYVIRRFFKPITTVFVAFICCCIFHQINQYFVKICNNEIWKSLSNPVNSLFMLCTNYGTSTEVITQHPVEVFSFPFSQNCYLVSCSADPSTNYEFRFFFLLNLCFLRTDFISLSDFFFFQYCM